MAYQWNPRLLAYLQGMNPEEPTPLAQPTMPQPPLTVPPSWQTGATVASPVPAPRPAPPQINLMDYFKAIRPELFSQESMDRAIAEDEETNRNRGIQQMLARSVGFFTRQPPDYTGMGPADAAVKRLGARQDQAMKSAQVGGQVGQFMQTMDAQDPRSAVSMRAYAAAMTDPTIAARVRRAGGLGQVSAAQIETIKAMGKEGAGILKDEGAGRASNAQAATAEAGLPFVAQDKQAEIDARKAATAGAKVETQKKTRDLAPVSPATLRQAESIGIKLDPGITEGDAKDRIAEAQKAAELGGKDAAKTAQTETDLRKEFQGTPMFTEANAVANAYRKVLAAPAGPKGDVALVYAYVKILDPGSVVREGEIQLSKEGRSYETQVRAWLAKAQSGDGFTPDERKQFRESAKALHDSQMQNYRAAADNYRRIAEGRGADPGKVVLDLGIGSQPAGSGNASHSDIGFVPGR